MTVGLAILKELGDSWYRHNYSKESCFWDKRGGSWQDVGFASLSIVISFPLRRK